MISPRIYTAVLATLFLFLGLISLMPSTLEPIMLHQDITLRSSFGGFLGIFELNILNKIIYIALGITGLYCSVTPYHSLPSSMKWSRVTFYSALLMLAFGIFESTHSFLGIIPLGGNLVALHSVIALTSAYFGFVPLAKSKIELSQRLGKRPTREHLA